MSPPRELTDRWNRELRYFHFKYAHGGPANDFDLLFAQLAFEGEAGLLGLFDTFGSPLQRVPAGARLFVPGQRYESTRGLTFTITAWPRYVDPQVTKVFGITAQAVVGQTLVWVHLFGADGQPGEVTQADFHNAQQLEAEFDRHGLKASKPASV